MAGEAQPAESERIVPPQDRPRGKARRWPGAQLDVLASITATDIEAARARWREVAPTRLKALLDAVGTDG